MFLFKQLPAKSKLLRTLAITLAKWIVFDRGGSQGVLYRVFWQGDIESHFPPAERLCCFPSVCSALLHRISCSNSAYPNSKWLETGVVG
jgi:hypothetical protein